MKFLLRIFLYQGLNNMEIFEKINILHSVIRKPKNLYFEKTTSHICFHCCTVIPLDFFENWDSLYARLNSHYEAWSYKKAIKLKTHFHLKNLYSCFSESAKIKKNCWSKQTLGIWSGLYHFTTISLILWKTMQNLNTANITHTKDILIAVMNVYANVSLSFEKKKPQQGHPFTKIAKIKTTKMSTDLGCEIKNTRELVISRSASVALI